jgi:hypothetical protein
LAQELTRGVISSLEGMRSRAGRPQVAFSSRTAATADTEARRGLDAGRHLESVVKATTFSPWQSADQGSGADPTVQGERRSVRSCARLSGRSGPHLARASFTPTTPASVETNANDWCCDDKWMCPQSSRLRVDAYEAVWACRLCFARISTPVKPPGIQRWLPHGGDQPWVYDWYWHVISAQRLNEAAKALQRAKPDERLRDAIDAFDAHWGRLRPLRNVVEHPPSRDFNLDDLWVSTTMRLQKYGADPEWEFTIDQLHDPVEALYTVIEQV